MARYLLLCCDVDDSPELVFTAQNLARNDSGAEFVLLVPASALPALDSLFSPYATPTQQARHRAQQMRSRLEKAGIAPVATRLGNGDPIRAIADALRFADYAAVVVACPPRRLMHRLQRDLACRLAQRFPQVTFVHALQQAEAGEPEPSNLGLERRRSS